MAGLNVTCLMQQSNQQVGRPILLKKHPLSTVLTSRVHVEVQRVECSQQGSASIMYPRGGWGGQTTES